MCVMFQPIQLLNYTVELAKPGRFPSGTTEIPFEMPLHAKGNRQLYETYHGVFVNIQVYTVLWFVDVLFATFYCSQLPLCL